MALAAATHLGRAVVEGAMQFREESISAKPFCSNGGYVSQMAVVDFDVLQHPLGRGGTELIGMENWERSGGSSRRCFSSFTLHRSLGMRRS